MPTVRRPRLIDLVDGEELWRPLIGGSDLVEKLISDGAERMSALGHLGHVDVRVEVIEDQRDLRPSPQGEG